MFHRCVLPPSSGWWSRRRENLKSHTVDLCLRGTGSNLRAGTDYPDCDVTPRQGKCQDFFLECIMSHWAGYCSSNTMYLCRSFKFRTEFLSLSVSNLSCLFMQRSFTQVLRLVYSRVTCLVSTFKQAITTSFYIVTYRPSTIITQFHFML
jgi:hypothetical protein